jgi:hypothetical protein
MIQTHHPGFLHMYRVPLHGKHYIEVFIWDTAENMRQATKVDENNYFACAIGNINIFKNNGKPRLPRRFGEMHF